MRADGILLELVEGTSTECVRAYEGAASPKNKGMKQPWLQQGKPHVHSESLLFLVVVGVFGNCSRLTRTLSTKNQVI